MASYKELAEKPASDYLVPENFRTSWDGPEGSKYREEQYRTGLSYSENATRITIGQNSVWGASMKSSSVVSSYEGIGYHACTADLLRGFLDGPAEIVVYRAGQDPTIIKPART